MRLEEYWGIGPKTRDRLQDSLGTEAAVQAIESGDVRTLVQAGLDRGRATRILRRSEGGDRMDLLATRDARAVYKELLDLAQSYAVTRNAADRIKVLTPLATPAEMTERLDAVEEAMAAWDALDESTRTAVLDAFEAYDSVDGGEAPAVRTACRLAETGVADGVFAPLADLDGDLLDDAATALSALDGSAIDGEADSELATLRAQLAAVESLASQPTAVVEDVQSGGLRGTDGFRDALVDYVTTEADVSRTRVREAVPGEAVDAESFVRDTLRELTTTLRAEADERETEVREELEAIVHGAREEIDAAIAAVDDVALYVSLARFALAFDLSRPEIVDDEDVLAMADAQNLFLAADEGTTVQPVSYAIGDHEFADAIGPDEPIPEGDRVAVLTGANSGGKTTLLETLCQVSLLAQMGLPVPASRATVGIVDAIVFHRLHASFNAGVLESTLQSIVPPLTERGRTLVLVDEFEAITEPGSAADLLHGLVELTTTEDALGVFVTHLADDLEPLPSLARTDGIFAEGLTPDLELEVDYQPRFETVGRSTPEFIVSRLVANASERTERAGFETLAEAVGEAAVQRTLADARWSEGES
jgi:hypothetical protein